MKECVLGIVLFLLFSVVVASCVIFIPENVCVLYLDTGEVVEFSKGFWYPSYSVDNDSHEICVTFSDGTRHFFTFEKWYRVEDRSGLSLFQKWTTKGGQ